MGRVEDLLHRRNAMPFLAARDVALGEVQVAQDRSGVGPLLEQVVVLEEMVVAERGVRGHQGLHGHGVFLHQVDDARVGVDDELVGKAAPALPVEVIFEEEVLAERPVAIHQRHADRGIGVEHLLGRDDLDLVRVDVEAKVVERDRPRWRHRRATACRSSSRNR